MTLVSVVAPVYRCDSTLVELYERTRDSLNSGGVDFEIIFVHDGCSEESWKKIQELAHLDKRVHGLKLSRNFGQHPAIMAGLRAAKGSKIAVVDCDLQDPIELLPRLVMEADDSEIVLSLRNTRGDSPIRRLQASIFTKLLRLLTGQTIDQRLGGISMISNKVAREYVKFSEPDHHFLYILMWLGFRTKFIEIDRSRRVSGKSSYRLFARLRHAARGIFFFSSRAIAFVAVVGLALFTVGLMLIAVVLVQSIGESPASGWLSTVSLLVLFSGFNVALTSIVGLYVTRVFEKVKERPLFVVAEEV